MNPDHITKLDTWSVLSLRNHFTIQSYLRIQKQENPSNHNVIQHSKAEKQHAIQLNKTKKTEFFFSFGKEERSNLDHNRRFHEGKAQKRLYNKTGI